MNPASRILVLYDKALNFQPGTGAPFLRLWGSALGISENADHTHEDEVAAGLTALRAEIELLRARLLDRGCPPQLFDSQTNRIKAIASTTLLGQDCKGVRTEHKNEVRLVLEWAAWTLPDDEDEMPSEEMSSLLAELDGIAVSLDQAGLPPRTRDFIARQIDLIRAALRLYGIRGIAPVKEALERSLGAVAVAGAGVAKEQGAISPEGRTLLQKFAGVIDKVAKVADNADKIRKGAEVAGSLGAAVHSALTKYLPPGSL